jgi:hypothetical protein
MTNNMKTNIIDILKQVKIEFVSDKHASLLMYKAFVNNMLRFEIQSGSYDNDDNLSFDVNSENYETLMLNLETVKNVAGCIMLLYGDGAEFLVEDMHVSQLKEWLEVIDTNYREPSILIIFRITKQIISECPICLDEKSCEIGNFFCKHHLCFECYELLNEKICMLCRSN